MRKLGGKPTVTFLVAISFALTIFFIVYIIFPGLGLFKVAFVTNISGLNDNSFNYWVNEGLEKAKRELGVKIAVEESRNSKDYEKYLTEYAEKKYDLIVAVGPEMEEAVKNVAERYPDTHFVIIDGSLEGYPNVASTTYETEQAGYVAGVLAGLLEKTDAVPHLKGKDALGIIGGISNSKDDDYIAGFIQGVRSVNPDVRIILTYTGRYNDPVLGNKTAKTLIDAGAGIIFQTARGCNTGVIDVAASNNVYVIGTDTDQGFYSEYVLTSAVKRIDISTYKMIENALNGEFRGGIHTFDFQNDGVSIISPNEVVPDEITVIINETVAKIKEGSIVVTKTIPEEFKN